MYDMMSMFVLVDIVVMCDVLVEVGVDLVVFNFVLFVDVLVDYLLVVEVYV